MEENKLHFLHIMLYYSKKGKDTTETQEKTCAVCGEGAVSDWPCQKRFEKVRAGAFLLDDAPQPGRPAEVDSDQITTLIENNQRSTVRETADKLKISKPIKLLVKMTNVSFMGKTKRTFWPTW